MLPETIRAMSAAEREDFYVTLAKLNAMYRRDVEAHGYYVPPTDWAAITALCEPGPDLRLVVNDVDAATPGVDGELIEAYAFYTNRLIASVCASTPELRQAALGEASVFWGIAQRLEQERAP